MKLCSTCTTHVQLISSSFISLLQCKLCNVFNWRKWQEIKQVLPYFKNVVQHNEVCLVSTHPLRKYLHLSNSTKCLRTQFFGNFTINEMTFFFSLQRTVSLPLFFFLWGIFEIKIFLKTTFDRGIANIRYFWAIFCKKLMNLYLRMDRCLVWINFTIQYQSRHCK